MYDFLVVIILMTSFATFVTILINVLPEQSNMYDVLKVIMTTILFAALTSALIYVIPNGTIKLHNVETMKEGKMPADFIQRTIEDLGIGESCYTMSWAISVDKDRNCIVREDYPAFGYSGGTLDTKITKTKNGYIVNFRKKPNRFKYIKSKEDYIKGNVIKIITE